LGRAVDGIWIVYLFLAAFPGLIIFAAIYKYFEVRRASVWPSVPGRVVVSMSEKRSVDTGGADSTDTEIRNFAKVVYEYKVATKTYRCDRVSVGENLGNFEVAETLAKYPLGKAVTVYYNPNNRAEALLEREFPAFVWKGLILFVLGLASLVVGCIFGFKWLARFLEATIPNTDKAPFVTACIGFALLFGLVVFGMHRASVRARQWPIAPGRVETSDVQAYEVRSRATSESSVSSKTKYRPNIVYGYDVAGVHYRSDKFSIIRSEGGGSDALAQQIVERYPVGTPLTVHYNPDNPSESALDPRAPLGLYFFYLVPVIVLAIGYLASR
jgi:hypothetical protein